jgi:hypothetical protein
MKRNAWLIPILLLQPSALLAQDGVAGGESPAPPPSYNILRFDENYSCLSNATNRSDWFDPIKHMPLRTNAPSWYLTLGGELRERFEGNHDPNFGIGSGSDSYWLQRATLPGDLHLGERVRICVEGISGLVAGESQPAPALKTASAYVGTVLDVTLEWRIQRHISFLASCVHFISGEYIHAAGGHDVDYVSTTLDFPF